DAVVDGHQRDGLVARAQLGAHVVELDARFPVTHGLAHRALDLAQEVLAARREHQTARGAAEVRAHHALAAIGLQEDAQRLLDILLAANITQAAGRIGLYGEAPAVTDDVTAHVRSYACTVTVLESTVDSAGFGTGGVVGICPSWCVCDENSCRNAVPSTAGW